MKILPWTRLLHPSSSQVQESSFEDTSKITKASRERLPRHCVFSNVQLFVHFRHPLEQRPRHRQTQKIRQETEPWPSEAPRRSLWRTRR